MRNNVTISWALRRQVQKSIKTIYNRKKRIYVSYSTDRFFTFNFIFFFSHVLWPKSKNKTPSFLFFENHVYPFYLLYMRNDKPFKKDTLGWCVKNHILIKNCVTTFWCQTKKRSFTCNRVHIVLNSYIFLFSLYRDK